MNRKYNYGSKFSERRDKTKQQTDNTDLPVSLACAHKHRLIFQVFLHGLCHCDSMINYATM